MAKTRRTEPLQAVVRDSDGVVENVIVCDQATADLFDEIGVFPGATLHDVTGMFVGVGWTWAGDRTPAFRPAPPTVDATWDDDLEGWVIPPPPPEPEPDEEPVETPVEEPVDESENTPSRA